MEQKATVRREPYGETNNLPIAGNNDEMFAPSCGKNVYRLAPDGECTGVCQLPNNMGYDKKHCAVLTGGQFIISDAAFCINILSPGCFSKGKTPAEPVFITQRTEELAKHFAPWAATTACKGIIKDVLSRLVEDRSEGDFLELDFLSTTGEICTVKFSEPATKNIPENFPASHHKAAELHGSVVYDNGDANGFYWSADATGTFDGDFDEYDFEPDKKGLYTSNAERYAELASAGQNWFMIDRGRTNKLGEPMIITFNRGGDFEGACIFGGNSQKKTAYGIPGFIFRVLGHYILEDDPRFEDCGMG